MTRGKERDRSERALTWVALGAIVTVAVGWAANRAGVLRGGVDGFARPLLVASGLAVYAGEAIRMVRETVRCSLMRWSGTTTVVAATLVIVAQAGALADLWADDALPAFRVMLASVPLVAAGLFADAMVLRRRGVPRPGPAGAAAGGVGLIALTVGTLTPADWASFASLPLLAFAGFALFRVRGQLRAMQPASTEDAARVPTPH